MASDTTIKGELAALRVDQRAIEKGFVPLKPIFECPYDRVLEKDGKFYRVQVKFVGADKMTVSAGCSVIRLDRISRETKKRKTYSSSEIDVVIAYIEAVNKLVWLTPERFEGKVGVTIRDENAKNGQIARCLMLSDVEW